MIRVAILQYRLLHYRLKLFSLMREHLKASGVELLLVHGQASQTEKLRRDEGELDWAHKINNTFFSIMGRDLVWQSLPAEVRDADLCIVMQENRILTNYVLQLRRVFGGGKLAYWGHGRNFQSNAPEGLRERWKKFLLTKVDWWYAYADMTVQHLLEHGYDAKKITNLHNAIDVSGFQAELAAVGDSVLASTRRTLGIAATTPVGLFCGSLYPEKRIDLLLESADLIRTAVPEFHLVVIGDGPSAAGLNAAAAARPWVHCVGVRRGIEKAALFRLARVQLNPGAVGLHVLDAFAAGLPMITTATSLHGPEIAYLRSGINGVITPNDDPTSYAHAVIELLTNVQMHEQMAAECLRDAQRYTVENMARHFSDGIVKCLEHYGVCDPAREGTPPPTHGGAGR